MFEEECVLAGLVRGGLVEALMNREWGFGELGEDRRWGGDISRVSGPWRGGGFMMDLVREVGGSVMVVGSIPPPPPLLCRGDVIWVRARGEELFLGVRGSW